MRHISKFYFVVNGFFAVSYCGCCCCMLILQTKHSCYYSVSQFYFYYYYNNNHQFKTSQIFIILEPEYLIEKFFVSRNVIICYIQLWCL